MRTRYQRLLRIYNTTDLIYRIELQHIAHLDHQLIDLAKAEADERNRSFSTIPYQLIVTRLDFFRIQRLKLTEEMNRDIESAMNTGQKLKRIGKLLGKMKKFT